jgi:biopolymer transport protein ExbD
MGIDGAPRSLGPRASINVTPLVDVVLVLLIIFMLVAPILSESLELASATPRPVPSTSEIDQIRVTIRADGTVLLNGRLVEAGAVEAAIRAELRSAPERPVFFEVDDPVPVRDAVAVMDVARGAGARTLAAVISE